MGRDRRFFNYMADWGEFFMNHQISTLGSIILLAIVLGLIAKLLS